MNPKKNLLSYDHKKCCCMMILTIFSFLIFQNNPVLAQHEYEVQETQQMSRYL
jgi:hypothetical protein